MLTKTAEEVFGGRKGIAARLTGFRTPAAVYLWGEVVPRGAALRLASMDGRVKVDESLYNELGQIIRKNPAAAA